MPSAESILKLLFPDKAGAPGWKLPFPSPANPSPASVKRAGEILPEEASAYVELLRRTMNQESLPLEPRGDLFEVPNWPSPGTNTFCFYYFADHQSVLWASIQSNVAVMIVPDEPNFKGLPALRPYVSTTCVKLLNLGDRSVEPIQAIDEWNDTWLLWVGSIWLSESPDVSSQPSGVIDFCTDGNSIFFEFAKDFKVGGGSNTPTKPHKVLSRLIT